MFLGFGDSDGINDYAISFVGFPALQAFKTPEAQVKIIIKAVKPRGKHIWGVLKVRKTPKTRKLAAKFVKPFYEIKKVCKTFVGG